MNLDSFSNDDKAVRQKLLSTEQASVQPEPWLQAVYPSYATVRPGL